MSFNENTTEWLPPRDAWMNSLRLPSPVQELQDQVYSEKNVKVFIKRDDLIHPFLSGNKWRKLNYIVRFAKRHQKRRLITYGGAYSNHLLATACVGAMASIKTVGIVRGEKVNNNTLFLCRQFGMELNFLCRRRYKIESSENHVLGSSFQREDLVIPEGGACSLGRAGCADLADETLTYREKFDHVLLASGTGTTSIGLANALALAGSAIRVDSIAVLKGFESCLQSDLIATNACLHFHTEYHRGGYAKTDDELDGFAASFSARTGILIEQVYTAKAMIALNTLVKNNYFSYGSKILFLHTGGLIGALGFRQGGAG